MLKWLIPNFDLLPSWANLEVPKITMFKKISHDLANDSNESAEVCSIYDDTASSSSCSSSSSSSKACNNQWPWEHLGVSAFFRWPGCCPLPYLKVMGHLPPRKLASFSPVIIALDRLWVNTELTVLLFMEQCERNFEIGPFYGVQHECTSLQVLARNKRETVGVFASIAVQWYY